MQPINWKTLSFTTTAMPRPEIVQATYHSFTRNLHGLDFSKVTLYINIDSFPRIKDDHKRQEVVDIARRYFGNVVVNMPDTPSFAVAVKWCFSMIETPYNFHLEDDWELLTPFQISSFNQFFIPPHVQQVALRSRGNVRQDFFLCPSFIRGNFCREMAEKMNTSENPEVEIRNIKNKEGIYRKESFVMYPFDTQSLVVRDTGRAWIKTSSYERGGTHFVKWYDRECDLTHKKIKILFPDVGTGWQRAFNQCEWLTPFYLEFKHVEDVATFCLKNNINLIFAPTLKSQLFLIEHKNLLMKQNLKFMVNNKDAIRCFGDKQLFHNFMLNNGFGSYVPEYYNSNENIPYPCIIKKTKGSGGDEQKIIHSHTSIDSLDPSYIISQYILGKTEYASNILYTNGKILNHTTYKKTFACENYILGQDKPILNTKQETPFLEIFKSILDKTAFSGVCCFDYKILNGIPKLFEINARIGFTIVHYPDDFLEMIQVYIEQAKEHLVK